MVIAAKIALAYAQLCFRYLLAPPHDIVLVGYLGHFDVFPARLLSWLRRKPLVFDAFVSLYDTSVEDRKVFRRGSLSASLLRLIDRWSCKLSDLRQRVGENGARLFRDHYTPRTLVETQLLPRLQELASPA